jgi:MoxR-like ATPase
MSNKLDTTYKALENLWADLSEKEKKELINNYQQVQTTMINKARYNNNIKNINPIIPKVPFSPILSTTNGKSTMSTIKNVITPSEAFDFIMTALQTKIVPYLAGPPGIGKSQIVYQVAEKVNAKVIDLRLSQILSEDMTGLPERHPSNGKAQYLPFDTFPLEGDSIPDEYDGWILFLDELSSASEEVLAASYSLILDKTVGGKALHPKCLIVAAGNRSSDSAIARELPDTLITRMAPVTVEVSANDWIEWAEKNTDINESVREYIKENPNSLYSNAKSTDREELQTYPTPRGWEKVSRIMNFHETINSKKVKITDDAGIEIAKENISEELNSTINALIAASVGIPAAVSFSEDYNSQKNIPFPWEIAASPASCKIPSTHIQKVKVIESLVPYFVNESDTTRNAILQYVNRISSDYVELFVNKLSTNLGSTKSDKELIEKVEKRLNIDPLIGSVKVSNEKENTNIPF